MDTLAEHRKYDLVIAATVLIYTLGASIFSYATTGVHPLAIKNSDLFIIVALPVAGFIGLLGQFGLGMTRRERIAVPMSRWGRATAIAACFVLFLPAFTAVKISIPQVAQFWADEPLAEIDRWLHFGVDPWRILHGAGIYRSWAIFDLIYGKLWSLGLVSVFVVLVYFEANQERRCRYLMLYVLTWATLGNILAFVAPSAGPIYLERLTGDARFHGLMDSLMSDGYEASAFYTIQKYLWTNFTSGSRNLGVGISAFPSVHVGVACMMCLYASERSKWLVVPGWLFVAAILVGSVYCGFHYAIDGYVAIAVVATLNYWLRRRIAAGTALALTSGTNALSAQFRIALQPKVLWRRR